MIIVDWIVYQSTTNTQVKRVTPIPIWYEMCAFVCFLILSQRVQHEWTGRNVQNMGIDNG